jgi:hypothetical protein
MAIKLPHSNQTNARASAPNTPVGPGRKPPRLRRFSPPPLGQPWPGHWPGQPGANFAEQGAIPGRSEPILGPLGGKLGRPLDITQVAEMIGCSPWSVRQTLIPRGLPHFRFKASGRLTFYEGQVIRWIESQQQGGQTTK